MENCNKFGVPLWAIRRLLICRINLHQKGYGQFEMTEDGWIIIDGKCLSHVDYIYYDQQITHLYMPSATGI